MNVSEDIRDLYKTVNNSNIDKQYIITVEGKNLKNDSLVYGTVKFTDSICKNELVFGECNTAGIEFKCAAEDIGNIKGTELNVELSINNNVFQFGKFIVDTCEKTENKKYRTIIAYDFSSKFDTDVSDWYNALSFPITMYSMLISLCQHVGVAINIKDSEFINDVEIYRGMEAINLSGKEVLSAIAELNAGFFKVNENGEIVLKRLSNTVKETIDINSYSSLKTESYCTEKISKLIIRQQVGDVGVSAGSGKHCYVIEDNFLIYGSSTAELKEIANNILLQIKDISYKPFNLTMRGLPYLEVGDYITIDTVNGSVSSFLFNRILSGTQNLVDTIETCGTEGVKKVTGIERQLIQLKGKTNVLEHTIETTKQTITDIESGLESKIIQTADEIESQITKMTIGGRNLISNTSDQYKELIVGVYNVLPYTIDLQSADITADDYLTLRLHVNTKDTLAGVAARITQYDAAGKEIATHIGNFIYINSAGYTQVTALIRNNSVMVKAGLQRQNADGSGTDYAVKIKKVKLEIGIKATDWTCDPEDTNTTITNLKQDVNSISANVKKIDPLTTQIAEMKQDFSKFQTTVSKYYTTKEDFEEIYKYGRNYLEGTNNTTNLYRTMGSWNLLPFTKFIKDIGLISGKDYITFSAYINNGYTSSNGDSVCARIDQYNESNSRISAQNGNYIVSGQQEYSQVSVKIDSNCSYIRFGFGRENGSSTAKTFSFLTHTEKLEKGKNRTDWCQAVEDISTSITQATQTANQFKWIVKSGTSESNMLLTDKVYELISNNVSVTADQINLIGYTTINEQFKIDTNGKLHAVNGEFSGKVTADSGKIGKWNIDSNGGLYADYGLYRTYMQPAAQGIGADTWIYSVQHKNQSNDTSYTGNFIVYGSGKVSCKELESPLLNTTTLNTTTLNATTINTTTINTTKIYGTDLQLCGAGEFKNNYSVWIRPNVANYVGGFCPKIDAGTSGSMKLGTAAYRWTEINAASSTIVTSDRNLKDNIRELDENVAVEFIIRLISSSYILKDGQSGRIHWGLIAQEVEEVLNQLNLTTMDFAGIIKAPKTEEIEEIDNDGNSVIKIREIEGDYVYALRYEEFISPMIKTIQYLYHENELLKNDIKDLKSKVQNILEELNME